MNKPSVFVGSSTEGLEFARAARSRLGSVAEVTLWEDEFFSPGKTVIESLMDSLSQFDFAVLVLTPDDLVKSHGSETFGPRDNVVFELGLFMGNLGRARTFLLYQAGANVKLPSDLAGLTVVPYDWPRSDLNYRRAVGGACDILCRVIRESGPSAQHIRQDQFQHDGPLGIHHVNLPVKNLENSIAFYRDIVGLTLLPQLNKDDKPRPRARPDFGFPGAWLEFADGQQLHLVEFVRGRDGKVTFRGSHPVNFKDVHFAIKVRDYYERYRICQDRLAVPPVDGPLECQFYILDPDFHIVEITALSGPGAMRE
jgi:catechol 2,3-dioxygenase-like lactoylglutathione lyase family enzyme